MLELNYFLRKAEKEKWAVPQFNFSNLEILKAIVSCADSLRFPVIVGTSEREVDFLSLDLAVDLVDFFRRKKNVTIFLNLDHGKSFEICKKAIDAGYDTCSFDGSSFSFKENLIIAKKVVEYAKSKNADVEGEIDEIGSSNLTEVDKAVFFCKETGVSRLALNVGTRHAFKSENIDLKRIKEIKKFLPNISLVLHGASGVSNTNIRKAINSGISKVNISTLLRKGFTDNLRRELNKDTKEYVPYKYMPAVIKRIEKIIYSKVKILGCINKI
jgi:tagatose 1,6-diphosphate aldolase GatY/KbaY